MKDYLRRNWLLYLILILACVSSPVLQKLTGTFVVSFPSAAATWHFLGVPFLAAIIITVTSVKGGRYDHPAIIFFWVVMLVSPYIIYAVMYGGLLLANVWFWGISLMSIPGALAFFLSILAYRLFTGTIGGGFHMKDYLRRSWWLYLILILACAALPFIQRWEAVPVLSPPSFVFTWYAAVIPIAAAAAAAVTSAGRGRFDFAPIIAVAVLVFLSMVIPVLISGGVFDKPLYVPLIFSVIPAIEALILSGIAYAIFGRRKTA